MSCCSRPDWLPAECAPCVCLPNLRFTLPFCNESADKITLATPKRITTLVIGIIVLIAGILALIGVPGFSALGTIGGLALILIGAFVLFSGGFLRCLPVETGTPKGDNTADKPKENPPV